jgi:CHAD domain-containing protein
MSLNIKKTTRDLKSRRRALLEAYDDRDLHKLRINIRRIRGLLKQSPDGRARKLGKHWKRLAQRTNAARDWDTLALFIRRSLEPSDWAQLQPILEPWLKRARKAAIQALESKEWAAIRDQWKSFLRKSGEQAFEHPALVVSLPAVQQRVHQAKRRAFDWGDEASWHGFRIAVKELRYTLDNLQHDNQSDQRRVEQQIRQCKRLQDDLGSWHDTVVHRRLLAEMADDPVIRERPELARLIHELGRKLAGMAADCLQHVRTMLQDGEAVDGEAGNGSMSRASRQPSPTPREQQAATGGGS